jgi:hypothetical protein
MKKATLILSMLVPWLGFGQSYSIDWFKLAGGGGSSANTQFSLSGTIGQPDAGGPMTGGNFSFTGGFWALYVLETPHLPKLIILRSGPNSAKILWPATGSYTMQENTSLTSGGWTTSVYAVTNGFGTNFMTVAPVAGTQFFRLKQ